MRCHPLSRFGILRMIKWKTSESLKKMSPKVARESCQNLVVKKSFFFLFLPI